MTQTRKNLLILEQKTKQLDFMFFEEIKDKLPYKNPYFLVCLMEVIHNISDSNSGLSPNLNMIDLLNCLNKKAEYLYANSNISDVFDTIAWDKDAC